ncbi:uncharacterized protein [Montipora foliosa]|uniref:uncharacterized protein isoform X2 n=1 Tax=Montipora foliosa TaxID=591990 RepID=UPI0035F11FEB
MNNSEHVQRRLKMFGQSESDFDTVAISESCRNLYNVLTSPVPFECSDTIPSPPLSPSASQSVYLEPDCKVLTPVPNCQPRVSTPHPLIDSVASRKDWLDQLPNGQQFQGGLFPSNSQTSHQYAFPQTSLTSQQNISGQSFFGNDLWYPGDSPMMEGVTKFGTVDERTDVIEQDWTKVTSSTELGSSWNLRDLTFPSLAELFNSSKGDIKFEGVSPVEVTIKDEKYQHGIQHCGLHIKPPTHGISNEVRAQTPWRLKKPKPIQVAQLMSEQKERKAKKTNQCTGLLPSKAKRKRTSRKRQLKIKCLSTMLPWKDPKNNRPSRKGILESAARCIMQLLEDICESYLQKRLKTEELKAAALQGNMVFNLSNNNNNCQGDTCKVNDASLETDVGGSPSSTPDLVVDDDFSLKSESQASELSSQGSEVSDSTVPNGSKTRENAKHVKRPMNAFILFSTKHRTFFNQLYPGKDNRKISTLLAEKWRSMKPEEKEPYRMEAKELMRQTKESHPDFKYFYGVKKSGTLTANGDSTRPPTRTLDRGYRGALYANGKDFKPALKRTQCQRSNTRPDKTENIMKKNNLPTTDYEMLLPATLESKSVQKSVTLNAILHQDDNHHFTMQNLKSSESHGSPVIKANVEWHPSACDLWVHCDKCKECQVLPDGTA